MGKLVFIDKLAEKDLGKLPEEVENKFRAYLNLLEIMGMLSFPDTRKITRDLFEIRVHHEGSYRGLYAYVEKDFVVVLHVFQKKVQKTPLRHIGVAEQRLKKYK